MTGNRKEPAELKLEEFCAVCEEQISWQTARRLYSANITEVYICMKLLAAGAAD